LINELNPDKMAPEVKQEVINSRWKRIYFEKIAKRLVKMCNTGGIRRGNIFNRKVNMQSKTFKIFRTLGCKMHQMICKDPSNRASQQPTYLLQMMLETKFNRKIFWSDNFSDKVQHKFNSQNKHHRFENEETSTNIQKDSHTEMQDASKVLQRSFESSIGPFLAH
jgi:hypothetical protein